MSTDEDEEGAKGKLEGPSPDPQNGETNVPSGAQGDKPTEVSLATRVLRRLRTLAVRHLAPLESEYSSVACDDLPSSLVQVLAWEGDSAVETTAPSLLFTSETAHFTLNPSYLLLDLGVQEDLPTRLQPQLLFRIVQAISPLASAIGGDSKSRLEETSEATKTRSPEATTGAGQTDAIVTTSKGGGGLLAEFVVDVRSLWSLHPNIDLCQLRLPSGAANTLVLVTEEGGARGPLVIQQDTYEALKQLHGTGGPGSSPPWSVVYGSRCVDEAFLTDLEDSHHQHHHHAMALQSSEAALQQKQRARQAQASGEAQGEEGQEAARKREERQRGRLRAEVKRLREQVYAEERLLEEEEQSLASEEEQLDLGKKLLHGLMARATSLEEETTQSRALISTEKEELVLKAFLLESRQVKLVHELSLLYPLQRVEAQPEAPVLWSIRGLELPLDVEKGGRDEEHVASALGYVCHLVFMLAKYLQVPLRYVLEYKGSRSQVRDPAAEQGPRVLPLYKSSGGGSGVTGGMRSKAGGGERESAMRCLCRDIYQLLQARGLEPMPQRHMLENVQRLLTKELGQRGGL